MEVTCVHRHWFWTVVGCNNRELNVSMPERFKRSTVKIKLPAQSASNAVGSVLFDL